MVNEELEEYKVKRTQEDIKEIKTDLKTLSSSIATFHEEWRSHQAEDVARTEAMKKLNLCIEGNGKKGILDRVTALEGYVKIISGIIIALGGVWGFVAWIVPLLWHVPKG